MLPRKYIMFLNLISVTLTFISVCLAGTQYSLAHAAGTLYFLDPAIESYNKSDSDKELHLIPNVSDPFSSVGGVTVDGFIVPMQQYSGPGIYKSTCSETKTLNSGDILREDADEEPGPQPAPPQDPASAQPPIEEPTPPQQADPPKKEIDYTDTTLDYSGSTYTGGSTFIQPVESKNISTVRNAGSLAEDARARELIESAKASMKSIEEAARKDIETLKKSYKDLPAKELGNRFKNAVKNLNSLCSDLETARGGIDKSERVRFRNVCLNARDKAATGLSMLNDSGMQNSTSPISPFDDEPKTGDDKTDKISNDIGEALGNKPANESPNGQDALANKFMMLAGLPSKQKRDAAFKNLQLAEKREITMADGSSRVVTLIHNGYMLGDAKTAVDCSKFVSAVLPADIRKGAFTTMDFRAMWIVQRTGKMPKPPRWDKNRAELVRKTARGFIAVNLYGGEKPMAGDLLIFRMPWKPIGHIFIVKDYDQKTMRATVIEAAQSAGTVRERELPVSLDPMTAKFRMVRPGFLDLRLKPVSNAACAYRELARIPKKRAGK
ncbi:MAG: hypothetical protein AABZ06_10285 [Bdellovibrionota bacterium]